MKGIKIFYDINKAIKFNKIVEGEVHYIRNSETEKEYWKVCWEVECTDKITETADFISDKFNDDIQMIYRGNTDGDWRTRIYCNEKGVTIYYCEMKKYIEVFGLTEVEFANLCAIIDRRLKERKDKAMAETVNENNNDARIKEIINKTDAIKFPNLIPYETRAAKAISPIINIVYDEGFRDGYADAKKEYKEDNNRKELKIFADGFSEGLAAMWGICKFIVLNMTMDQMIEAFGKNFTMESVFDLEPKIIMEKISKYYDGEDDNEEDLLEF